MPGFFNRPVLPALLWLLEHSPQRPAVKNGNVILRPQILLELPTDFASVVKSRHKRQTRHINVVEMVMMRNRAIEALINILIFKETPHITIATSQPCSWSKILSSPVKRHSKLTPWRHRKLTPEETAYVDRLPAVHRVPRVSWTAGTPRPGRAARPITAIRAAGRTGCHPEGRSGAEDVRSTLTRRPARSGGVPTGGRDGWVGVEGVVGDPRGLTAGRAQDRHGAGTSPRGPRSRRVLTDNGEACALGGYGGVEMRPELKAAVLRWMSCAVVRMVATAGSSAACRCTASAAPHRAGLRRLRGRRQAGRPAATRHRWPTTGKRPTSTAGRRGSR